jgi:hypothetical protein
MGYLNNYWEPMKSSPRRVFDQHTLSSARGEGKLRRAAIEDRVEVAAVYAGSSSERPVQPVCLL